MHGRERENLLRSNEAKELISRSIIIAAVVVVWNWIITSIIGAGRAAAVTHCDEKIRNNSQRFFILSRSFALVILRRPLTASASGSEWSHKQ
jgi:hypothetical protein